MEAAGLQHCQNVCVRWEDSCSDLSDEMDSTVTHENMEYKLELGQEKSWLSKPPEIHFFLHFYSLFVKL